MFILHWLLLLIPINRNRQVTTATSGAVVHSTFNNSKGAKVMNDEPSILVKALHAIENCAEKDTAVRVLINGITRYAATAEQDILDALGKAITAELVKL